MRTIDIMGQNAKAASRQLAVAGEKKNDALKAIAKALLDHQTEIMQANQVDLDNGKANGLSAALLDSAGLKTPLSRGENSTSPSPLITQR